MPGNVFALLAFVIIFQSIIIILLFQKNIYLRCSINPHSETSTDSTKTSSTMKIRSTLLELGTKYKTDKVFFHHYETLYEKHFESYRDKSFKLLEIGLGCGQQAGVGASAKVWREYFGPLANIHFIEFDKQCADDWYSKVGKDVSLFDFSVAESIEILISTSSSTSHFILEVKKMLCFWIYLLRWHKISISSSMMVAIKWNNNKHHSSN